MKNRVFSCKFADYSVNYSFLFTDTVRYFRDYLSPALTDEIDIQMSNEYFSECKKLLEDRKDGYIEYKGLISLTSQYLLKKQCCILHGVSFIYNNVAWLLCGPSGTGKTTQYRNWKRKYADDISVISGDMPLLQMKDNHIYVYPTPWNGKEGYRSKLSAPLGGIVCLEQGNHNKIEHIPTEKGVIRILNQFQTIIDSEEDVYGLSKMTECIFLNYPVISFTNTGDIESTEILRKSLNEVYHL